MPSTTIGARQFDGLTLKHPHELAGTHIFVFNGRLHADDGVAVLAVGAHAWPAALADHGEKTADRGDFQQLPSMEKTSRATYAQGQRQR